MSPTIKEDMSTSGQFHDEVDILDEFLDKRLYEDTAAQKISSQPQQQQQQAQPHQHSLSQQLPQLQQMPDLDMTDLSRDEDVFSTFLTDDINQNDYLLFNGTTPQTHMLGVDDFHIPEDSQITVKDDSTLQTTIPGHSSITEFEQPLFEPQQQQSQMQSIQTTPRSVAGLTPPQQEIFTTPRESFSVSGGSNSSVGFGGSYAASPYESSYESARSVLSQLKFGRESPAQFQNIFPKEYLDIDASTLPYKLRVDNLPSYSRVETQIKLQVSVSPPPPQFLIQLPADTIAKQKLCLQTELSPSDKESMLFLDTYVLTASTDKPCNICGRCVRREQKRASRRKSGVSDNLNWMTNANKRAIIFNCKEVISFPAIPAADNSRAVEISSRIVCYCRHHSEAKGFKLLVILKDPTGRVMGKYVTSSVMIMDRKKHNEDGMTGTNTASNSANEASATNASSRTSVQPISPTSFEDDSSEPHTSDSRVFKRKRTWSPELSDGFSIAPSRKPSGVLKKEPISPQSQSSVMDQIQQQQQQQQHPLPLPLRQPSTQQLMQPQAVTPLIQRVIPAQGPLRGGIEVTLLGSNFKPGLLVKFGVNRALSTQCWSDSTMVTYLPPSSQPGQVVVTIEDTQNAPGQSVGSAIFTYLDDTDRQMIELALQIVGLKMNGKLEDARNIARKIIGSDGDVGSPAGQDTQVSGLLPDNMNSYSTSVSDEDLILKVINRLSSRPNWAICTAEGQTLLHLSALKGYARLVSSLLQMGARVDYRDIRGYTPLHYAALSGNRKSIELMLNYRARVDAKNDEGLTPEDIADSNVLDMFKYESSYMSRKLSSSSMTSSIFSSNDDEEQLVIPGGLHVSRMTADHLTDGNDSEAYDSDSYGEASNEESEFDWEEERENSSFDEIHSVVPATTLPTPPTGTSITDGSLWNKMRNVFTNTSDQEQLPQYDDLYPVRAKQFTLPKLRFPTTLTSTEASSSSRVTASSPTQADGSSSSDEGEDVFMKFFNQRKNVQNDKMLLFFWLPLLVMIVSWFILMNAGYTADSVEKFQTLVRQGLGTIMLGNERVKIALNRHFNQVNDVVTSVIHAG